MAERLSADRRLYYVYGFGEAASPGDPSVGVAGAPVAWLECPPVVIRHSPWTGGAPAVERLLALAHARVVESAAANGPFLPCPAGTVATGTGLCAWVAEHEAQLVQGLRALDGQVEFSLKLWPVHPPDADRGERPTGRAYLGFLQQQAAAERERVAGATAEGDRLAAAADGLITAMERPEWSGHLFRTEFLVARANAERFRAALAPLLRKVPADLRARLSGPWPPYYYAGVMVNGAGTSAAAERFSV